MIFGARYTLDLNPSPAAQAGLLALGSVIGPATKDRRSEAPTVAPGTQEALHRVWPLPNPAVSNPVPCPSLPSEAGPTV